MQYFASGKIDGMTSRYNILHDGISAHLKETSRLAFFKTNDSIP
jgi:hypothetical protein